MLPYNTEIPEELKVMIFKAMIFGTSREIHDRIAEAVKIYVTQKVTSLYLRGVKKNEALDEISAAFGIVPPEHRIGD